jgi:flagellar L-ring protein FlgH
MFPSKDTDVLRHLFWPALMLVAGCTTLEGIGQAPEFTPPQMSQEHVAMMTTGLPYMIEPQRATATASASLWTGDRGSLLGDRRAMQRGDILTVVIEIDDSAAISNSSDRSRSASQGMTVPQLFGLPQNIDQGLPTGATMANAVELGSNSRFSGDGSVSRNEQLELRVAATIVDVLPNGVLEIVGNQEVRVNYELRALLVTGYVRPTDITRQNEITYDKIAQARISYGGRGLISDMQQPRYGQQAAEILLPF